MIQQVNLYLPELQPSKEWLTANTILFSGLGFMALMFIAQLVLSVQLSFYEKQVVMIEDQKAQATDRLTKVSNMPKPVNSLQLDEEVRKLRVVVDNREQVQAIIGYQNLGNAVGFSKAMEAIARQSSRHIALEKFRLSRGGYLAEMDGQTLKPESIPLYLKKLREATSFANTRFGLLTLENQSTQTNSGQLVRFTSGYENLVTMTDSNRPSTYKQILNKFNGKKQ